MSKVKAHVPVVDWLVAAVNYAFWGLPALVGTVHAWRALGRQRQAICAVRARRSTGCGGDRDRPLVRSGGEK
jgi:hypothetical protein